MQVRVASLPAAKPALGDQVGLAFSRSHELPGYRERMFEKRIVVVL